MDSIKLTEEERLQRQSICDAAGRRATSTLSVNEMELERQTYAANPRSPPTESPATNRASGRFRIKMLFFDYQKMTQPSASGPSSF
ncbi:unnamed protein product [Bursaphelenchus okinawaensis]|uniref:Uncharacterized protein n=1 Tax=Bursaphelenchus okinawaensis TaxID=465554 RepID=A0A811KP16_9BILA|nr:unnamed protein product [Bursaphelenchus okinawaensis]CAG9106673.1 unnamed protein product [Bursaphelenchus okinawaensis]